jgi:translocation and assembly module TamB
VHVQRLCLTQGAASLCGEGGWRASSGLDVTARLTDFDLARLASYLPEGAEVTGRVDAAFEVKGAVDRPRVTLSVRPDDGLLRFTQEEEALEVAYHDVHLDGRFENDEGQLDMRLKLDEQGQAQGGVSLGPERDGQRTLAGQFSADFPDLGLVAGFVPALEQVSGRLHLESTVGGTLGSPQVSGRLQVLEAGARLPAAGIALTEIGLEISADGDAPFLVQGGLRSGQGRLEIEGEIDARSTGAERVDLRIRGQDVQVARLPEAEVEISPDLRLQGAGPYHLSGTLRVPRSRIELSELPRSTVAVSADEIVVGEQEETAESVPRNLTARVRLELGDEVSFSGFGLQTRLTGTLDAATDAKGTRLDGRIDLQDARYKGYGQELTVERGRLLFAGPPANPDIDLRAVRESRDGRVKAYLAVTGPLSKPASRVYSEPALPDAEALAYLLTGSGLDEAGKGEGVDIAAAALELGLSKGDPLLQDLGDRLGIDDLKLESGAGGIESSSLLLGKYLNPDLYLGYSQGLFNPEGAVLLRLRVTERLELESRSGNEQSVDLFYRLEHD